MIHSFVEEIKASESGVMLHRLHPDAEVGLPNEKDPISQLMRSPPEEEEKSSIFVKTYTLMILVDLSKGVVPMERLKALKAESRLHYTKTKTKGGDLFTYSIDEAKGDPVERQLVNWAIKFKEKHQGRFFNLKFFELRPSSLRPISS